MYKNIRKQAVIVSLPFIAMLVGAGILLTIKFGQPLSEKGMSGFPEGLSVIQKQQFIASGIKNPIKIPKKKDFPRVPLSEIAPPLPVRVEKKVSLILLRGGVKTAIINGILVKEGDKFDNAAVVKIEKDRVLIKDRTGEEWIKME